MTATEKIAHTAAELFESRVRVLRLTTGATLPEPVAERLFAVCAAEARSRYFGGAA